MNLVYIVSQNNAITTNYIKVKIDNSQGNSKYRLCGDGEETINPMIKTNLADWCKGSTILDTTGWER